MIRSSHIKNHMHEIVHVTGRLNHGGFRVVDSDGKIWDTNWENLGPARDEDHEYDDTPSWREQVLSLSYL